MGIKEIIKKSNSQAGQDIFAYYICNTNNGYFIDLGAGTPIGMNNTYLLEQNGWNGLNFDMWDNKKTYNETRKTPYIMEDVNKLNMSDFLNNLNVSKVIDYLSFDIDESTEYFLLNNFPKDYEFKTITFEHNLYCDGDDLKNKSKKFFSDLGYTLLCENVAVSFKSDHDIFEDWWINEKYIDIKKFEFLKSENLHFKDIINKIKFNEDNMKICLYTMVINEEDVLPFFLDYYTNYVGVNKIVIYDGGSTDKSHDIINSYPNTKIIFEQDEKTDSFRDLRIWNEEWKKDRNDYDWMIVCTPDEFLYHNDLRNKLLEYKKSGITIPLVEGFDMISINHPRLEKGNYLPYQIKRGIKDSSFLNKNIIFNPKDVDINYQVGCHGCNPTGNVKWSDTEEFKLLHFKWLSYDFLIKDGKRKHDRLSQKMLETGAGSHYKVFTEMKYEDYLNRYNIAKIVLNSNINIILDDDEKIYLITNESLNDVNIKIKGLRNNVIYQTKMSLQKDIRYWFLPDDKSFLNGFKIEIFNNQDIKIFESELIFQSGFHGEMVKDEKPIEVFWHCYLINNWKEIMEEQMILIINSGLYNKLKTCSIHLCYHGDDEQITKMNDLIYKYDKDNKVIFHYIENNFYEYPTLQKLYEFSKENNSYILYFHLKGVWSSMNTTRNSEAIKSWRKCLEYFNIEKWNDCLEKLKNGYEVVGSLYNYNEKEPLFSGNFWWSTSDYIKKLKYPEYDSSKNPYFGTKDDDGTWCRVECEKWINTIPNKFYNFFAPKDYGFYYIPINEKDYRKEKMEHFYEKIDGWFDFQEVYSEIVNRFPDYSHFVEVGAWMGKSSSYMAVEIINSKKNITFDVVDTWDGSESEEEGHKNLIKNLDVSLYDKFLQNMSSVINHINPKRGLSEDISKQYKDNSLDFVFIDAGHDYESVKNDIISWYPKVKKNGIIAGHDYNDFGTEGHEWVGVVKAVNEFFGKENITVRKVHAGTWIVEKEKIEKLKIKQPKISVIIPTYNRFNLLKEAIQSVFNQNYNNFEILISHDGQSEKYENFKKENEHNKIFYFQTERSNFNEIRIGASIQRNLMLNESKGDYIIYLDDDNILYDNYLKKMVEQIDDKTGMVVCRIHFNDKEWNNLILPPTDELIPTKIDSLNVMIRSDIAKKFQWDYYDIGHDHRHINSCEKLCNELGLKIKFIPDVLANHRFHNRIDLLLKERRLEQYQWDDNGVNRLFGLKDMIDENLNKETIVCEIGSFEGKSSEMFALLTKQVYCVDPWVLYPQIDNESMIKSESIFDLLLTKYDNIVKIKNFSIEASKLFNDKFFDCVYIDGDHDYEPVKQDILHWMPKVKDGGHISGHDYHFEGVRKALDELFVGIELKVYSDQSWIVKIDDYRKEKKPVIIMTAHPNFKTSEDITKQSLESLKPLNIDTMLCTHCPTSPNLQNVATHFLFDKNNPLIRHDYYEQSWFDKEDYYSLIKLHKNDNDLQHALAVYINYYNGILHAKSLGYKTAICTNFDIVFHEDDLDIIKCKINEMKLNNKKSFYMTSKSNEGIHYKTIFFITDIDFFIENFKYVTNENDYNLLTREVGSNTNCLENVFYQTLKSKSDQLLLQQIDEKDLFSVSKVNLFSNIEYFTILPLKNDNEHFVIWFSSSNSFDDNRDLTIKVFKNFEGSYLKNDVITKNYIFFHKIKFERNHTYNISCEITYNGDIKKKNIIINNESFDKLKENGEFWDKKGILK